MQFPTRVWMMMCDAAQIIDGKFYVMGGGFELFGPDPQPFSLVGRIDFDRSASSAEHKWELYLEDPDGRSILPEQFSPISQEFKLDVPDNIDSEYVSVPFVVSFASLALPNDQRFTWRMYVDSRTDDAWFCSFRVRSRDGVQQGNDEVEADLVDGR